MVLCNKVARHSEISREEMKQCLYDALGKIGNIKKALVIPPDYTRYHSQAGLLTKYIWEYYRDKLTDILPAIGTHSPMEDEEIIAMFDGVPKNLFRVHNWRKDIITLGNVPSEFIYQQSEGKLNFSWSAQVNKLLDVGNFDLIISIGQVVPHEVAGMANYNKNIFVGCGGVEGINKSHFLGAVYGIERILGKADNPVRRVLNYATEHFAKHLPIIYILTVVANDSEGKLKMKGLFIGDDIECFNNAAQLSLKVNFTVLDEQLKKIIVYLNPNEFKSTWLGNKSIYRTRMAIADEGELIILAPGVKQFGEDKQIDALIRKYGYVGSQKVVALVEKNDDLKHNLSAAAHLIHGSSENRFRIIYCPGYLSKSEIESVNFEFADLNKMMSKYNPEKLSEGFNIMPDGEKIFFISNPALGLWAHKKRFNLNN